ncbi:phosphotransferase [Streptomyces sp. DSM 44915]|uniref:Phosphotransferase n=1 Tax=Streptomyces chisholmiae TaxID=3075540 RepID=A0ABU2JIC7_9ACTN|nr:phosphotransferase [Streptomyces sp. DSM 44915]MDT0264734.1 phosphotransferase [Streptomyces sp. DSM 44915]
MSSPPSSSVPSSSPAGPVPGRRRLRAALADHWGLSDPEVSALPGGMNSITWRVVHGGRVWVAKAVPDGPGVGCFRYGLDLAARVEAAVGVPTGTPVPAGDGRHTVPVSGHRLALLRWVSGRELTGRGPAEHALLGATLGRVHRALGTERVTATAAGARFDLLAGLADTAVLTVRRWLRPAVEAAVERLLALRPETLTWGPVHGDPAPEHFRLDPATGRCGLIDWGAAGSWVRLYDLATVVMDAGGPERARPLLAAYLRAGALTPGEVDRGLVPLLDFRYAVNALYYADRILRADHTGLTDPTGNEERLADARRWLHRSAR